MLVPDAVLAGGECRELGDVGTGDEGAPAGTSQDADANRRVGIHLLADADERVVHVPGHGIPGFGPVERHEGNRPVGVEQDARGGHVRLLR